MIAGESEHFKSLFCGLNYWHSRISFMCYLRPECKNICKYIDIFSSLAFSFAKNNGRIIHFTLF